MDGLDVFNFFCKFPMLFFCVNHALVASPRLQTLFRELPPIRKGAAHACKAQNDVLLTELCVCGNCVTGYQNARGAATCHGDVGHIPVGPYANLQANPCVCARVRAMIEGVHVCMFACVREMVCVSVSAWAYAIRTR